jgi:hypothetical protein
MMRMAAIYARVSSEQQREENTIASQTAALIEFAKSHDLEVPREWVFEDEVYSGATLERPGLERVRDLAAEGQIPGDGRELRPCPRAAPPEQDTIAPAYHRAECRRAFRTGFIPTRCATVSLLTYWKTALTYAPFNCSWDITI